MHKTAMKHGKLFFDTYLRDVPDPLIVDLGAQDVNGSLRSIAPALGKYVGVDFEQAMGVDVVIDDPYSLPFETGSVNVIVSSSCFEHSEFFWLTFLEAMRILKPNGLFYLNAPSNGFFHRYPVDCWRFYPDSGVALQNWGRRNGMNCLMLESFIGKQHTGIWNDFVAVFVKDQAHASTYRDRMQGNFTQFTNGLVAESATYSNFAVEPEDQATFSSRLRRLVRDRLLGGLK